MNIEPEVQAVEHAAVSVEDAVERALAGVERWYAEHFHAAAVSGTQPITSADKAALTAHVAAAIRPAQE